jgi:hypothetical protein
MPRLVILPDLRDRRRIITRKMLQPRYLAASLDSEQPERPASPNPLQIISSVVTALVATASLITQWKGNRLLAFGLVAIALVAAISTFYRPLAMSTRKFLQNLRRNRVARRSWKEFLRIEKRFGAFLNENDTVNLRNIISEICGRNADEVSKVCGPAYLSDYYGLIYMRHLKKPVRTNTAFHFALAELHQMTCSYNRDYVLDPFRRLNGSQLLGQLQPHAKDSYQEKMKQFRERWVRFLDDLKEFFDKTNHDLRYDHREAIGTYFEYPKAL